MSRYATRIAALAVVAVVVSIAACNDTQQPLALNNRQVNYTVITPSGTLDQNITSLLGLFDGNGALAQWKNIKRKYSEGLSDPQQMQVAKKMHVELVKWVKNHASEMSTPPAGETKDAAAARLILYMSMYIYSGPTSVPPEYTPAADVAVDVVEPAQGDTIVTPAEVAGIGLEAGSVAEPTTIVITQNPTPYPANCSGPLQTKLCQYPRFYHIDQFPHVKLLKTAKVSVCHINGGTERTPLADHDRFRLAHTLPASPADYTAGSTIRDTNGEAIEILPLVTQTFVNCGDVEFTASGLRHTTGTLTRLAKRIGNFFAPTTAYAIDQGYGGGTDEFSDFNDVDPLGTPEREVTTATVSPGPYHEGDHVTYTYHVRNTGTATATPVPVDFVFGADTAFSLGDTILRVDTLPEIVPGDSITLSLSAVLPPGPTGTRAMGIRVHDDPVLPETNLADNKKSSFVSIQLGFASANNNHLSVGEATVCALNPFGSTYCWGDNGAGGPLHQYGSTQPASNSPVVVTGVPSAVTFATGHSQHKCEITAALSANCWGRGGFGQLGRGTIEPTGNNPAAVVGGISWARISTGRLTTCGVSTTGAGYCWGANQRGEIGSLAIPSPYFPTPLVNTPTPHLVDGGHVWKTIVTGWLHACGITTGGQTYCWGDNTLGELGIGAPDTAKYRTPQLVAGGHQFIQLSLHGQGTCAITVQHDAYCWGENALGQLGNGTVGVPSAVPSLVSGGIKFSFIATASGFGDGSAVPLPVVPSQANKGFTCALNEQGAAYCWGWNGNGQLGDGTTTNSSVPVPVGGGHLFNNLAAGGSAVCGAWFNQVWCWGSNLVGQLGNGTFVSASLPVLVSSPFDVP